MKNIQYQNNVSFCQVVLDFQASQVDQDLLVPLLGQMF